jgi:hypothetical protein
VTIDSATVHKNLKRLSFSGLSCHWSILKRPMSAPCWIKKKKSPQIRGIIPISQIRKFIICASPQNPNLQFFLINPKIANSQISKNNPQDSKQP